MANFARVVLPIPTDEGFTYRIPEFLHSVIQTGSQVIVPFGNRFVSGIVVALEDEIPAELSAKEIKDIRDVVDDQPVVPPDLILLMEWIARYYVCYLGEAYRLLQFQTNLGKSRLLIRRLQPDIPDNLSPIRERLLRAIPTEREIPITDLNQIAPIDTLKSHLYWLARNGFISRRYSELRKSAALQSEKYYRIVPEVRETANGWEKAQKLLGGRSPRSRALLEFLHHQDWTSLAEIKRAGFTLQNIRNLLEKKLIQEEIRQLRRHFGSSYGETVQKVQLTREQKEIVQEVGESLKRKEFRTYLLHGITGSGKTQIYIELIRQVVADGRQALVLVPEIVLTPQTLARFRFYFGDAVGVIHSRLTTAEKREVLYRARKGELNLIIGPRSAVFAPFTRLGLIVVDEEHETSYKQTDTVPRYHARDVAIYRAKLNQAVVVLGSATPSFESLYNARQGRYGYFYLHRRIEKRKLPRISIVSLKEEWKKAGQQPVLSEHLELKIESRLLVKDQVMILHNRRGFSPYLLCKDCGYVAKCPNCEVTLTFHLTAHQLVCHYCGHREPAPDVCPQCQGLDILYKGIGTQKLEEELNEKFPHARVLRMDMDTTRGRHGHLNLLEKFRSGQADILVGTRMIAKGLDFKRVTLVGITSADQGLHFPDFRANEKVFQLLTQAAGRAGRGEQAGEVVVQTFDPNHFIFKYLLTHDYIGFYEKDLQSREHLNYPPFSRLILIRLEGTSLSQVEKYSASLVKFLWKANPERKFTILGPAPAPILKLQNKFRYQILIKQDRKKDAAASQVRHLLKQYVYKNETIRKWPVNVMIDVDPVEIL